MGQEKTFLFFYDTLNWFKIFLIVYKLQKHVDREIFGGFSIVSLTDNASQKNSSVSHEIMRFVIRGHSRTS